MNRPPPPLDPALLREAITYGIISRRSIRGFLSTPIDPVTINEILEAASRAPSGSNTQPWQVHVLTGPALTRLTQALEAAFLTGEPAAPEYFYYPRTWRDPYLARRREVGWALYSLAGIPRGDHEKARLQHARNYTFFGAPAGLVFTIDNDLETGSWLDYGMFLEAIMIAARGFGFDTCPQAAIANYPAILRSLLPIPETQTILCGVALGIADPAEPTNALDTRREPVAAFTFFHHD